jgi:HPt (histidine-containing phosphotransfer) domain-containing protein
VNLAQAKLDAVRDRFLQRMKSGGARLVEIADLLERDGGDEIVGELGQHAHRLAGSAGTFGFPEIGLQAASLEREALTPGVAVDALTTSARALAAAIEAAE